MSAFTINIPIRVSDAEDVKNAFAFSYGYSEYVQVGGVSVPNPISKEEFVKQKCINFMLEVTKNHLVKVEEIAARQIAEQLAQERAQEVTQWFDDRRLESIGGMEVFQDFPSVNDLTITTDKNIPVDFVLTGNDKDNLPLTFSITSNPVNGVITGSSPNFIYSPRNRFYGQDSFKFKANNGNKNSLEGTVSVIVNRTITSIDAFHSSRVNQSVQFTLSCYDNVGPAIFTILNQPQNGTITGENTYTYTPNPDFIGLDTLTFSSQDDTLSSIGTITFDVNNINVQSETFNVLQNQTLEFYLNTFNSIGNVEYNIVSYPSSGTLSVGENFNYTPNTDFIGTDSFTVSATDIYNTSDIATITFNVI